MEWPLKAQSIMTSISMEKSPLIIIAKKILPDIYCWITKFIVEQNRACSPNFFGSHTPLSIWKPQFWMARFTLAWSNLTLILYFGSARNLALSLAMYKTYVFQTVWLIMCFLILSQCSHHLMYSVTCACWLIHARSFADNVVEQYMYGLVVRTLFTSILNVD